MEVSDSDYTELNAADDRGINSIRALKEDLKYAPMVEFGTRKQPANPFFRSAIKTVRKRMLNKFRNKL